jgi:hypothetical protein
MNNRIRILGLVITTALGMKTGCSTGMPSNKNKSGADSLTIAQTIEGGVVKEGGVVLEGGAVKEGGREDRLSKREGGVIDLGIADKGRDSQICMKSPCDLIPQCGCKTDEACDLVGKDPSDATYCRKVTFPAKDGEACTGATTCSAATTCLGNSTWGLLCRKWCKDVKDCTAPGGQCQPANVNSVPVAGANYCSLNCDPLTSTGCPSGYQCQLFYDNSLSYTDCVKVGAGGQGATCADDSSCSMGFACAYNAGKGTCIKNCRLTPPVSSCPQGTTCGSWNPPVVLGTVEYGVCS